MAAGVLRDGLVLLVCAAGVGREGAGVWSHSTGHSGAGREGEVVYIYCCWCGFEEFVDDGGGVSGCLYTSGVWVSQRRVEAPGCLPHGNSWLLCFVGCLVCAGLCGCTGKCKVAL